MRASEVKGKLARFLAGMRAWERQQATGHGSCCAGQQICSQRRCVVHRANARLLYALAPCFGVDGHDPAPLSGRDFRTLSRVLAPTANTRTGEHAHRRRTAERAVLALFGFGPT